jgi:hypothetical protein
VYLLAQVGGKLIVAGDHDGRGTPDRRVAPPRSSEGPASRRSGLIRILRSIHALYRSAI